MKKRTILLIEPTNFRLRKQALSTFQFYKTPGVSVTLLNCYFLEMQEMVNLNFINEKTPRQENNNTVILIVTLNEQQIEELKTRKNLIEIKDYEISQKKLILTHLSDNKEEIEL